MNPIGPLGRLGRRAACNPRAVFVAWALIAVALGFFAVTFGAPHSPA
jgi:uncharacterized membrane protein YdfJ with MMPL/SSD domain